jgi:catechol 2,3-dioxygenase-like lactoylglutathione lyase family enzyme
MVNLGTRLVPSLLAREIVETVRFYTEILGFRLTGRHPDKEHPEWVELTRDGVALQFFAEPPKTIPDQPILSGTLYVYPDSVTALAEELDGKVAFEWGPEVMEYGMREFGIRDPNGYVLAFTEPA